MPGIEPTQPRDEAPASSSNRLILILVGGMGLAFALLLILSFLKGMKQGGDQVRHHEAKSVLRMLSEQIRRCEGGLPPTSKPVPSFVPRGKFFRGTAADWDDAAYHCGDGFWLNHQQRYQYQWHRPSNTEGTLVAVADWDDDGTVDTRFELAIACAEVSCRAGQPTLVE